LNTSTNSEIVEESTIITFPISTCPARKLHSTGLYSSL